MSNPWRVVLCLLVPVLAFTARGEPPPEAGRFRVEFDSSLQAEPYSGRVYIAFSRREGREPRVGMNSWSMTTPILSQDVAGVPADGAAILDAPLANPRNFAAEGAGEFFVQAIARRNPDACAPGTGAGDLCSDVVRVSFAPASGEIVTLRLSREVEERPFRETERVRLFEMVSPSLSAHLGRERVIQAGVMLPHGFGENPERRYPVIYFIGGFGGSHRDALRMGAFFDSVEAVIVFPDATCYLGHSVFADSANNGPWGHALVNEMAPEIDRKFRGAGPERRYVTGISSGGWSSLWLQVTYPDAFAGCWSHCPDPVDFRDFQMINLYAPGANMYRDETGERRPLSRRGSQVSIWYDDFVHMERVLGPGGQIGSFEAVFSPRGEDGMPRPLFDRDTGAVDAAVAKSWEKYDIRLVVERNWPALRDKLAGKLFVYAGAMDSFYLEGATALLKESLEALGSDAVVEIVPGMGHTIHRPGITAMIRHIAEHEPAASTPVR